MKFLAGSQLTRAIRRLIASRRPIKAAIAYWGAGAFETLGLDPRRKNVRVICCLANGKSDPKVISKFARRARQNDRLHAKVIWTPTAAIVSSANASSNGLPEEENKSVGLLEAGILIEDDRHLEEISRWFDFEFKKAARITKADLKRAKDARDRRILTGAIARNSRRKLSFTEALRAGSQEFHNQKIYFMLFDQYMTRKRQQEARGWAKKNQTKIRKRVLMPSIQAAWLDYYDGWDKLPSEAYLIDVFRNGKKTVVGNPVKTFPIKIGWDGIEYVLPARKIRFSYKFDRRDKKIIRLAAKDLWHAAYNGGKRNGILPLRRAEPVLLRYATD